MLMKLDLQDARIVEGGEAYYSYNGYIYHSKNDEIGNRLFYESILTEIKLPRSTVAIGDFAFWNSKGLKSIAMPNGVNSIGESAFRDCLALREIVLPEKLEVLKYSTFRRCLSLERVFFSEGLKTIESNAFVSCTSLKEAILPESLQSIESGAFRSCKSLVRVVVPFGVKKIGKSAFYSCSQLRYLTIPGNLVVPTGLYTNVFNSPISHTTIWEGTAVIQQAVLSSLIGGTLVFPKTLQVIREDNLHKYFDVIYCYATTPPTVLSDNALSPECKVYVPDVSVNAYKAANVWSQGQILPLSEAK